MAASDVTVALCIACGTDIKRRDSALHIDSTTYKVILCMRKAVAFSGEDEMEASIAGKAKQTGRAGDKRGAFAVNTLIRWFIIMIIIIILPL